MRLHFENEKPTTRVTSYGTGFVQVNDVRYTSSVMLCPDRVDPSWSPLTVHQLTPVQLDQLLADDPEVILLGTGARQEFPELELLNGIYAAGIGVEIMDTMAACRTFNVLAAENRRVVAGLILHPEPV